MLESEVRPYLMLTVVGEDSEGKRVEINNTIPCDMIDTYSGDKGHILLERYEYLMSRIEKDLSNYFYGNTIKS